MNFWLTMVLPSILFFMVLTLIFRKKESYRIKIGLLVGLFLMVFDFVVENLGKIFGFWESFYSIQFVLAVPIEVMIICIFTGANWAMLLPVKRDPKFSILYVLTTGSVLNYIEDYIIMSLGYMSPHANGWTPFICWLSYITTVFILHELTYWLYYRFGINKNWGSFLDNFH